MYKKYSYDDVMKTLKNLQSNYYNIINSTDDDSFFSATYNFVFDKIYFLDGNIDNLTGNNKYIFVNKGKEWILIDGLFVFLERKNYSNLNFYKRDSFWGKESPFNILVVNWNIHFEFPKFKLSIPPQELVEDYMLDVFLKTL